MTAIDLPRRLPFAWKFRAKIFAHAYAAWLRFQYATWRKDVSDLARMDAMFEEREKFIAAFWHGRYIPLFVVLRNHPACIFSSYSFRGTVIAEICRIFGYECMQIPDGGGDASVAAMRDAMQRFPALGVVVDGPLGPYHVVKRGVIEVASEFGVPVLPISIGSHPKRVIVDRWDRMELPRLFSRVILAIGEPFRVQAKLDREGVDRYGTLLCETIERLDERVDAIAGRSNQR